MRSRVRVCPCLLARLHLCDYCVQRSWRYCLRTETPLLPWKRCSMSVSPCSPCSPCAKRIAQHVHVHNTSPSHVPSFCAAVRGAHGHVLLTMASAHLDLCRPCAAPGSLLHSAHPLTLHACVLGAYAHTRRRCGVLLRTWRTRTRTATHLAHPQPHATPETSAAVTCTPCRRLPLPAMLMRPVAILRLSLQPLRPCALCPRCGRRHDSSACTCLC
jgi:hypothetical protein